MPITRTVGRGGCRATLHDYPEHPRVLVTIEACALTLNPGGVAGVHTVVHLEPRAVRELHETLSAFLAGDDA